MIFDKARAQIEEVKNKANRVVEHFKEHKEAYAVGTACFVGGVLLARKSVNVTTNVLVVNTPSESDHHTNLAN